MKKNFGFIRVAAASPVVKVADVNRNISNICEQIDLAEKDKVSLLVFPELCVTGYTCGDLFTQTSLLEASEKAVRNLKEYIRGKQLTVVVGAPVPFRGRLYNCAIVIRHGIVQGIVPKIYLPTYSEFYESRWFASGSDFFSDRNIPGGIHEDGKNHYVKNFNAEISYAGQKTSISPNQIFKIGHASFAVEICEDLWTPIPPSSYHAMAGAQIIVNLSASNEVLMKHSYRKSLVSNQSSRTCSAYIYSSASFGESTQDLVYAGSSLIYENGVCLAENKRFEIENSLICADVDIDKLNVFRQRQNTYNSVSPDGRHSSEYNLNYACHELGIPSDTDFNEKLYRYIDPHPFVPVGNAKELDERAEEITSIQVAGLASRLRHIGCKTAVIGISGGLDSTLALLITCLAFDKLSLSRKGIIGVTMPGFGTTDRTYRNAVNLMEELGISIKEISIVPAVKQHFSDIGHDIDNHDVTYENSQARERTQILMDIANKEGGIVVGTGDLSELALGWATYNGDHMSMYAVNSGVPKTLVKYLVKWAAENKFASEHGSGQRSVREILMDVIFTPISPELIPADADGNIVQITEDIVGPYELHDFFLYNFLRCGYSPDKLFFLAKKAFLENEASQGFSGPESKEVIYNEEIILKYLKKFLYRFFSQQFKRSCLPDGPKIGSVTLSPRGDWRMPSDSSVSTWIESLE